MSIFLWFVDQTILSVVSASAWVFFTVVCSMRASERAYVAFVISQILSKESKNTYVLCAMNKYYISCFYGAHFLLLMLLSLGRCV